ncbi:MAG: radical SAM protein [Nanoarchaeota archaeon]
MASMKLPLLTDRADRFSTGTAQRKGRVLLLTPNLKGLRDPQSVHRIQPSLGLMIHASVLLRDGHEVKIHDTALADFYHRPAIDDRSVTIGQSEEEIRKEIARYQPDIVGISALFSNLVDSAHLIARLVKEVNPRCPVILGGNHIGNAVNDYLYAKRDPQSGLPAQLKDYEDPNIDFIMHGEVDLEFPQLVNALLDGREISALPGLVQRKAGNGSAQGSRARGGSAYGSPAPGSPLEYIVNPPPAAREPLSALPHPARHLVDMEGYFNIGAFHSANSKSKRVVNVMASRGCPEKCTFCTTPDTWGSKVRWREIDDVIAEIREAKEHYKVGEIQFEDDTITANRLRLLALCAELEKVGLPWCTPNGTKVNYHKKQQREMYTAMYNSGCYQITLACESGVQRVLDEIIRKNLKVEEMKPAIEHAKEAGMLVHTFWVIGHPGETYEEIQQTIEFARSCGADSYSVSILSPLPGTPIYRQVVRENLWWGERGLNDLLYRNSLIKVDGFAGPEEFERFVTAANVELNLLLKRRDPQRFQQKYGADSSERMLVKQT